ncbi:MAG TPA: DNA polymerase III subunit alpha, partial [Clostridia bacterium]|nr:DNA polymerase III subunit alpha [Clostridia bacterium]
LYQEQVMRIASQLAGFTLGQADLLRRAMGKKKPEIIAAQRENFLQGALGKGIEEKVAGEIFDLMAYFAGYGFNKSHSAAYALLAYQTAFLKTHYPVAFMSALLSSVMGNTDKVTLYLEECRRLGIEVLPPDVNESQIDFTIMEGKTRFGLAAVKNVGISAIESILTARSKGPFTSLDNFCQRVDLRAVNKRVLESLIRCGAFSSLGWKRSQLLHMIESTLEQAQRVQEDRKKGQISFFDLAKGKDWEEVAVAASPPDLPEYPPLQLLAMEKETLGFYLSGHPVASYQWQFLSLNTVQIADLEGLSEGSPVRMGGIITDLKRTITKKGDSMAYLTLEDMSGSIRVLVFPKVFSQYSSLLSNDQIILLEGRLSLNDDEQKVFAEKITVLTEEGGQEKGLKVSIRENDAGYLKEIKDVVASSPGNTPLLLVFPKQGKCLVTDQAYWVELNAFLVTELEKICGKGSIRVMDCFNKNSFLSSH